MSNDPGFTSAPGPEERAGAAPGAAAPHDPHGPQPAGGPSHDPHGPRPAGGLWADPGWPAPVGPPLGAPPPPGPYAHGIAPAPVVVRRMSMMSMCSLICGATSFVFGVAVGPFALPFSIGAIVLGIIGRREIARDPNLDGNAMAIAGIVIGVVGVIISLLAVVLFAWLLSLDTTTYD